jgi:UPF0716 protein FxsA
MCYIDDKMYFVLYKVTAIKVGLLALLASLLLLADGFFLLIAGDILGSYAALAISASTGLAALLFAINTYLHIFRGIKKKIQAGKSCKNDFAEILGLVVGTGFLLIPGFLTDVLGIILYNKPMRVLVGRFIAARMPITFFSVYDRLRSEL